MTFFLSHKFTQIDSKSTTAVPPLLWICIHVYAFLHIDEQNHIFSYVKIERQNGQSFVGTAPLPKYPSGSATVPVSSNVYTNAHASISQPSALNVVRKYSFSILVRFFFLFSSFRSWQSTVFNFFLISSRHCEFYYT